MSKQLTIHDFQLKISLEILRTQREYIYLLREDKTLAIFQGDHQLEFVSIDSVQIPFCLDAQSTVDLFDPEQIRKVAYLACV